MKNRIFVTLMFLSYFFLSVGAQEASSPYFIIPGDSLAEMPLSSQKTEVIISGNIADVTLSQIFINNNNYPIEAIYIFPGSTQAAIYDLEMQIGDRIIKAELKEKDTARRVYEAAKQAGKRTTLLEQHRPNVFQMNVANILPNEKITVRLQYTELIIPKHGNYEFVLPTIVGPRFNQSDSDGANAQFASQPFLKNSEASFDFEMNIILQMGQEIQTIKSNSHLIKVNKLNSNIATISLDPREINPANRDFILTYRIGTHTLSSGILTYQGEDENFFQANIQPPNMISDAELPPREYIFILDISGSMFGFPLEISKKLMKDLLTNLREDDRFNILLFAGTSYTYSDTSILASEINIQNALLDLEKKQGGGSTMLLPALEKAINMPRSSMNLSRSMIILTDGYITVEKEAFELIRNSLNKANLFAFGIGSSTNRYLMEGLANAGNGIPFFVEDETQACDISEKFKKYVSTPSLTNITIQFENFEAYSVQPTILPDLFSERPLSIIGKFRGKPQGDIILKGFFRNNEIVQRIPVQNTQKVFDNKALRQLWARERLKLLDDYRKVLYNDDHKQEMIDLSFRYNLLSAYTSFVAVDYETIKHSGELKKIQQSTQLPAGVSEYAVGAEMEVKSKKKINPGSKYLKIGQIQGIEDELIQRSIRMELIKSLSELKKLMLQLGLNELELTIRLNDKKPPSVIAKTELTPDQLNHILNILRKVDFSNLAENGINEISIPLNLK